MHEMLTTEIALYIIAGLAVLLTILIPLLDAVPKLSNFISLRWICVAIILLIMVSVVVDFSHLADNTRDLILKGGIIIVGIYIILRTIEKVLYNGWLKGVNLKGTVKKGDVEGSLELSTDNKKTDTSNKKEDNNNSTNENQ